MRNFRYAVRMGISLLALIVMPLVSQAQEQFTAGNVKPPELVGTDWINTPDNKPLTLASRKGKVTVVEFWTFGCINCQRNLPAYARWQKTFQKKGVEIIGIHTPETDEEKNPENVRKAVKRLNITYPILLDTKGENWRGWAQQWWPTVWLVDKNGKVRYRWQGELAWKGADGERLMARKIQELLNERIKPEPKTAKTDENLLPSAP
jgi:thiol-disulfide isomerase/thioredoxin